MPWTREGRSLRHVLAARVSGGLAKGDLARRHLFELGGFDERYGMTPGGEDTDLRPSRFLTELAGDDVPIERVGGGHGAHRWLSMPALVADLRRAAAETGRPLAVRQAAAAQLAGLAAAGVRAAHPRDWYALTELSDAGSIVAGGETVRLSPSQVESCTRCGLRWLLEAAVGAGSTDVLRHLGTVIHAAAVLAADHGAERAIAGRIDEIWHHLDFGSAWYSAKQRALAERMVRRFLDWHDANPRELIAVEQALKIALQHFVNHVHRHFFAPADLANLLGEHEFYFAAAHLLLGEDYVHAGLRNEAVDELKKALSERILAARCLKKRPLVPPTAVPPARTSATRQSSA